MERSAMFGKQGQSVCNCLVSVCATEVKTGETTVKVTRGPILSGSGFPGVALRHHGIYWHTHADRKSHTPLLFARHTRESQGLVDCLFKQGQYMCTLMRMHKPTHAADTFTVYSMRPVYGPVLLPGSIPFIPIFSSLTFTHS